MAGLRIAFDYGSAPGEVLALFRQKATLAEVLRLMRTEVLHSPKSSQSDSLNFQLSIGFLTTTTIVQHDIIMPTSKKIGALLRSPIKSIPPFAAATMVAAVVTFALLATGKGAAQWQAPAGAAAKKNPFAGKADAAASGKQIFTTTCVACHGTTGRGDGPAAAALNPRPANYTTSAISGESDGALFWKMSEGRGAMVAFKTSFSEKQRWELVTYIRTLEGK
jgi:mono/diheme cytochrome c family protein